MASNGLDGGLQRLSWIPKIKKNTRKLSKIMSIRWPRLALPYKKIWLSYRCFTKHRWEVVFFTLPSYKERSFIIILFETGAKRNCGSYLLSIGSFITFRHFKFPDDALLCLFIYPVFHFVSASSRYDLCNSFKCGLKTCRHWTVDIFIPISDLSCISFELYWRENQVLVVLF